MRSTLLEGQPVQYSISATKVLHFCVPPHSKCFPLHWHDRMELLRITQGQMLVEYEFSTVVVSAGELMIISPKALHTGYTLDRMVKYDVIMFDVRSFYNETEVCKNLLPAIFDGRAVFKSVTSNAETIRCIDTICQDSTGGPLATTAKIYELLGLFYQDDLLEFRTQPKNAAVKSIVKYLEDNFVQEITTASLCEKFGYTAAHLCRKFKKATGLTPMTYLKIYRLETARKKIRNREVGISDIAAECGFSDPNYFTRCFKAHFGVPPTRYDTGQK